MWKWLPMMMLTMHSWNWQTTETQRRFASERTPIPSWRRPEAAIRRSYNNCLLLLLLLLRSSFYYCRYLTLQRQQQRRQQRLLLHGLPYSVSKSTKKIHQIFVIIITLQPDLANKKKNLISNYILCNVRIAYSNLPGMICRSNWRLWSIID